MVKLINPLMNGDQLLEIVNWFALSEIQIYQVIHLLVNYLGNMKIN